jgi:hypothetical protein
MKATILWDSWSLVFYVVPGYPSSVALGVTFARTPNIMEMTGQQPFVRWGGELLVQIP